MLSEAALERVRQVIDLKENNYIVAGEMTKEGYIETAIRLAKVSTHSAYAYQTAVHRAHLLPHCCTASFACRPSQAKRRLNCGQRPWLIGSKTAEEVPR